MVFKDPGGWLPPSKRDTPDNPLVSAMTKIGLYPSGGHLVKRVIGIAGDTITCCDVVGKVFVLLWPRDRFTLIHGPQAFDVVADPT